MEVQQENIMQMEGKHYLKGGHTWTQRRHCGIELVINS